MTNAPADRPGEQPPTSPEEEGARRRGQIPLAVKALFHGAPFIAAAIFLPPIGLAIFAVLAGVVYVVTSRKCPRCGRRTFEGLGLILLGPFARCSHCGSRFGG